ncbi:MAG: DUF4203 domain-containing protein [Pseudomonadota bacterium]
MGLLNFLIGVVLLTLGRKLFWLFVGCVGFAAGFTYVHQLWGTQSDLMILGIAIGLGLIGALLAIFFQAVAIALAGFVAGGYITFTIMNLFGLEAPELVWLFYLAGGIVGTVLLFVIFDWALIALSSVIGASLMVQVTELSPHLEVVIFFLLIISGVLWQARLLKREPPKKKM